MPLNIRAAGVTPLQLMPGDKTSPNDSQWLGSQVRAVSNSPVFFDNEWGFFFESSFDSVSNGTPPTPGKGLSPSAFEPVAGEASTFTDINDRELMAPPAKRARQIQVPQKQMGLRLMTLMESVKLGEPYLNMIESRRELYDIYQIKDPKKYGITLPLESWSPTDRQALEDTVQNKYHFSPKDIAAERKTVKVKLRTLNEHYQEQQKSFRLAREQMEALPSSALVQSAPEQSLPFASVPLASHPKRAVDTAPGKLSEIKRRKWTNKQKDSLHQTLVNTPEFNLGMWAGEQGLSLSAEYKPTRLILTGNKMKAINSQDRENLRQALANDPGLNLNEWADKQGLNLSVVYERTQLI